MSEGPRYVVAVTRWGAPLEGEIAPLAQRLGLGLYDARMKLAGRAPVIIRTFSDADEARGLVAFLRDRGHGAVGCDMSSVVPSDAMIAPRTFRLEEDALVAEVANAAFEVPWDDMLALVRAVHDRATEQRSTSTERKLSIGRAALTGGVSFTKTETIEKHEKAHEREQVLYVFRRGEEVPDAHRSGTTTLAERQRPVLLAEHGLRYDGLGQLRGPIAMQNFDTLVRTLRERAPRAFYDDRFVSERRRIGDLELSGTSADSTVSSSNASATDLAAHLLVLGHLRGAL